MKKEFEIFVIGEIKFFIGLQIYQLKDGIYIIQAKYIKEILKAFSLQDPKLVGTPMVTCCKLSKEDDTKAVNDTLYRFMIGLNTCTQISKKAFL